MTRMICTAVLAGVMTTGFVTTGLMAQAGGVAPAGVPAGQGKLLEATQPAMGPAAIREFKPQTYFHIVTQATQKTMPEVMKRTVPHLMASAEEANVMVAGPMVVVYRNLTPDPDAEFEVEVGVIVKKGAVEHGDAEVRELEPFRAATMTYSGNMKDLGTAYMNLYQTIMASGQAPGAEMRQMLLYWEDETSNSNVMLLQVQLQ